MDVHYAFNILATMILPAHKMTIVPLIFLLSLTPLVQTAQLLARHPYGGLVPENLLFNIKTTGAAGEYNEKPLSAVGIFAATTVNPKNPTTGRKYKRVVCPPGFTRAGDIIPGLDSPVPTAIHDIPEPISNGPSVEHVTETNIGGGSTPNTQGSPSTPIAQLFPPLASQSTPIPNPSAPGAASIPSVEHVTETTIGGDPLTIGFIVSVSPPISPPASPVSSAISPVNPVDGQQGVAAASFPVFPSSTPSIIVPPSHLEPGLSDTPSDPSVGADSVGPAPPSVIIPSSAPSDGKFFDATIFLPSQAASSPPITADPSVIVTPSMHGVAAVSSFPVFPTTTPSIIVPPSHLEPNLSDKPSGLSVGVDSVGPASPSKIIPSSVPSDGKFYDEPSFQLSQAASSPPITTDPSVTPPIQGVAAASSFPVFPTTTPSIIAPSHLEPGLSDTPSDPSVGADSVDPGSPSMIIPNPHASQTASFPPITTDPSITITTPTNTLITTSNGGAIGQHVDAPVVAPVVVPSSTTTLQTPDGPSSLHNLADPHKLGLDTTTLTPTTTDIPNDIPNQNTITPLPPITTVTTTMTPNDPPSAVQVIASTTSRDSSTETTSPKLHSDLQVTESLPPATSVPVSTADPSHPPSPPQFFVRQAITDPDACIPIPDHNPTNGVPFLSVQEIQPVPITTQITLTTSISGTLQTMVTLVTTTPPPVPIELPQATTALITFTTSESGTLVTVVTLVTTTPSLTNPITESITYVTLISGTPHTMVTVLTEEAFAGVATGTTIPFSEITILLDWPAPTTTTTSQSGFGGSFSTYREGITFWAIMCGLFIMGLWF